VDVKVVTLVEAVRQELQPVNARILTHPYLQALQAGKIGREHLQLFATQQSHIIESDLRSVALMVARASSESSRGFFIELLEGERAALQALRSFAAAIGTAPSIPGAGEPLPGAFAYSAFVAWLSLHGSEAEFAGAFLINLPVWGANCGRMAEALRRQYWLADADVAFFTLFATPPPGFEERAATVVAEGLDQGVRQDQIRRAAALLQRYELLFWDTLAEAGNLGT
jgi:pyrroloquinoline quinone (PQQ) biosynthesis protein C